VNLIKKLENNLIQMEDLIEIHPAEGRKRTKSLNRTLVEIAVERGARESFAPSLIKFRAFKSSGRYELSYQKEDGISFFRLKAVAGLFLLNGSLVDSCVLKKGDIIDLDYNRLVFLEKAKKVERPFEVTTWPKDVSFYLEGETGVGKSTLARNLHNSFVGENLPFIAINLSAFSESLIESELFGHEKGAFTGAVREKRGAVELARGGTLFIDEIDSLPLHLQVKLLTFLDDQTFRRVGGETLKKVNCRLIFASGRCLKKLVEQERFRGDLYFRILSGVTHKILPLREDPQKLEGLLDHISLEMGVTLDDDLRQFYLNQKWPGNIRQVRSHIMRKCIKNPSMSLLKLDESDAQLFSLRTFLKNKESESMASLDEVKRNYCTQVFLKSQGSYDVASRKLGIAVSTLRRLMAA
jgi:transcriptional regulator with PAS, ATPase and Fis domain